jgi:signal transduction histidine kinase
MALGALVGYGLARRLERPIARAADAVADIAAGNRAEPLPPEGPAELRQLAAAVNVLAARLRSLEEMRRRSFANIVHELGRPLGAVLAAVQVLRGGAGDDPAIRAELLDGVRKELTAMEPLLDDLSQLHAGVTGRQRLDLRWVALTDWLEATLPPWREAALAKGLAWTAEVAPDLPEVEIDAARMAQVVGNLLSNAIKYTEKGSIAVSAVADGPGARIAVADNGPGIPAEEQALIFEPFYRGRSTRRSTEGLGVGLSIARDLVEAHGGRLTLDSAPGRGSVFTIRLPVKG